VRDLSPLSQEDSYMATLAEIEPVEALLSNLLIGEPLTHGALTVVPLLAPAADEPDWLTLAEAGDRVRVTEVSEAGTVPFLKVANLADRPLLLLDGEQLVGAKQNRVLNTTVLVAGESELTIPVSCVEHGRWGYRRREMSPSDVSLYASVRRRKSQWVSEALRAGQGHKRGRLRARDELRIAKQILGSYALSDSAGSRRNIEDGLLAGLALTGTAHAPLDDAPVPGQYHRRRTYTHLRHR